MPLGLYKLEGLFGQDIVCGAAFISLSGSEESKFYNMQSLYCIMRSVDKA